MSNSGCFYKGINLNQIYVNNGNTGTISGYSGIPNSNGNQSNYSGMNPLSFGYNSGNIGLYNQVTANNTIITTTQNVNIPTGVTSCNIICVGGGGGNGGKGGEAVVKNTNTGDEDAGGGGVGGSGGYATYSYENSFSLVNYNTISVTIGNSGNNGSNGDSKNDNFNVGSDKADDGSSGNSGNPSYITISGSNYAYSNGGNGGNGGEGGTAGWNYNNDNFNYDPIGDQGSPGDAGNFTSTQANSNIFPALSNYGNPETQGAVQIIWLYN